MAFPALNAAKPLSSAKSCGSELHRLIIHCVKIVSAFISLKCIAFRSNFVSSLPRLLNCLCEGMIYFCPSSPILYLVFASLLVIRSVRHPYTPSGCHI